MCFVCWTGYRAYKKHKLAQNGMLDDDFASPNALLAKIPYFGHNQRAWHDMDSTQVRGSNPVYAPASKPMEMRPTVNIYAADSKNLTTKPAERQSPMALPQLDTNVAFSPADYSKVNQFSASTSSYSPHGSTPQSNSAHSPDSLPQAFLHADQQHPAALPRIQTNISPRSPVVQDPFASPEDGLAIADVSPISAVQYGGEGTMQTFQTAATARSWTPGYADPSELARAVNRASELSSLSSGFGDGDIIVPPPLAHQQDTGPRPCSYAKTARSGPRSRPASVAASSNGGRYGQRDTVYTAASDDTPARYRSVASWVSQQTGRVVAQQRQQRSDAVDVPPVPFLPPEQRLTMMMDDGEEPRRYEDTLSSQPPLPALPQEHVG